MEIASPTDPIRHVVVLCLENHSFDQMLGACTSIYPDLDGVDPAHPHENADDSGTVFRQAATTERQMLLDPHHELGHVAVQLAGANGGFVRDFARSFPASTGQDRQFIMGYYPMDFLPALHALARDFAVCDRWFASVPGPTWPNRFFALTGTSNGRVNMPGDGEHTVDLAGWFEQDQVTVFDRLTERGLHWKSYFHDIPQSSVLLHQRAPHNAARYFYIDEFFDDARGPEAEFPQFAFIEPDFMGIDENDDHPPHDIMKAEKLIADVYNALRANPALWHSTLLVVFYDEHGGFYDHVPPPAAVAPDDHHEEYTFDRLGVRVPALLVSPWVDRGAVHAQFDHTSVLKYVSDKWGLGPLGARVRQATSIGVALSRAQPRDDADMVRRIELSLEQLTPPDPAKEDAADALISLHHVALQTIAHYLKSAVVEDVPRIYAWLARAIEAAIGLAERWLGIVSRHPDQLQVSLAEPDKLSGRFTTDRDAVTRFMMRQKLKAVPALAARIRDQTLPEPVRRHAVHTLAILSHRPMHRRPDRLQHAAAWLTTRGH